MKQVYVVLVWFAAIVTSWYWGRQFWWLIREIKGPDCLFKLGKVRHVEGDSEDDVTNILLSEVLMVAWDRSGGIEYLKNVSCWYYKGTWNQGKADNTFIGCRMLFLLWRRSWWVFRFLLKAVDRRINLEQGTIASILIHIALYRE